mgnify:CR=1 FL=1
MNTELRDKIAEVARLRRGRQGLADAVQLLREVWEAENAGLLADLDTARQAAFVAEEELRARAVAVFRETGSKQPGPGLGIRVVKALTYPADAAVAWASAHEMMQFLRLDKAAFEKVAADLGLDFVTVNEVPTAQLAADLDKALKETRNEYQ